MDILYADSCTPDRTSTLRLRIGTLLPMGLTSIGRAWLGGLAPDLRQRYVAALRRLSSPDGAAPAVDLRASVGEIASSGVCAVLGRSGVLRGVYGVAAPLRVGLQRFPMAISCGAAGLAPDTETARRRIAPELLQAVTVLEDLLADLPRL